MAEAISDLRMLLHHSKLTAVQRSALDVAVLYFASKHKSLHIAAHLLLAGAGACIPLTPQLNDEIRLLINTNGTLHNLVCVLDAGALASPAAAAVLQFVDKLSALAEPEVLGALWSHESDLQLILAASCSSAVAAAAAAVLAVSAAKRSLPARAFLHSIFQPADNCKDSTHSAVVSPHKAQDWAEVAMTPMLQHLQQEICSWQDTACLHSTPQASAAAIQVQHDEVWLLLCSCINAAAAACCMPILPIEQLFSQPAVSSAIQAVLTSDSGEQGYQATVHLINQVSALSPALARCCFKAVAPVIIQLLQQQQSTSSKASSSGEQSPAGRAAAVAAVGVMWRRLLLRLRGNFRSDIEDFISQHLPLVARGIARQWNKPLKTATATANPTAAGDALSEAEISNSSSSRCSLMARITAFVSAASSIAPCTQALLQRHPAVVIAAVQPHMDALVQVIRSTSSTAAAVHHGGRQQQQDQDQVALLAFWLLQSLIDALQQQQQQCQQQGTWFGIVEAVTDLMNVSDSAADIHLRAAGLQLAHDLVKWRRTTTTETPAAAAAQLEAPPPSAVAVAGPELVDILRWHGLLTALVALFRQSRVTPRELSKRHLLLVACCLLGDLAEWHTQQYTAIQQQCTAAVSAGTLAELTVQGAAASTAALHVDICSIAKLVKESCTHLRALRQDLSRQRLERSSSSQDLVDAIDKVLSMLGHSHLYVHLMSRSSASSSVCMQLRML